MAIIKFRGYIFSDTEIIGIGPIKRKPAGEYFNTQMVLQFDLITKQQVIKMESEPVHYQDSANPTNPELEAFTESYEKLKKHILNDYRFTGMQKDFDLPPTLTRHQ